MSKIVISAIVENISTRADNTFKIVIGAQEIDKQQVSDLFELRNQYVKILLSNNNITPLDDKLIDEVKIQDGKRVKTKSQRYRAIQYILWEQSGSQLDFDTYYNNHMEEIIQSEKNKINE